MSLQPTTLGSVMTAECLESNRLRLHPHCVVCSPSNPMGLGQEYRVQSDGSVEGTFSGGDLFEGYSGMLHGGITAALLDGAMTNCLFAVGVRALTAELTIRYREPVAVGSQIILRARQVESDGRLHILRAELRQDEKLKVTALGKFIESHG